MLGTTPIAAVLGSCPPNTSDLPTLKQFVRATSDIGLALMLCAPGSKEPLDMRSSVAKRADDKAAQESAKEAGRPDWARVKSMSGLYLATTEIKTLDKYLTAARKRYPDEPLNFAIEVGRSRRIVVDCDTTEQREAFLRDAGLAGMNIPPTVQSPGAKNAAGEWVHYDGGHYYFTVPEGVELPTNVGMWTSPDGYAVLWRDRYVLIPPSTRAEGAYAQLGLEYPAPDWLLEKITAHGAARVPRAREDGDGELATVVDDWAEQVSWADLLGPLGWAQANRYDNCGCDVWTAPGPHDSPKSATTHDGGCSLGRYTEVNAPMHIWTHNPGEPFEEWISEKGTTTLTKLQVYALANHGGKIGEAMEALGMTESLSQAAALEFGLDVAGLHDSDTFEDMLKAGPPALDIANDTVPSTLLKGEEVTTAPADDRPVDPYVNPQCPHQDLTTAGRCTSCGVRVAECAHPNRCPEDPECCAVCGEQVWPKTTEEADDPWGPVKEAADEWPPTPAATVEVDNNSGTVGISGVIDGQTVTIDDVPAVDGTANPFAALAAAPSTEREEVPTPDQERAASLGFGLDDATTPPSGADEEETPTSESADTAPAEDADENDPAIFHPAEGSNLPRIMPFEHWRGYPKPEYAIEGLVEQGGLSMVFGPSGVGKSVVVIDMLCHIATGRRWHGRKTIQQKVLYMPGEGVGGAANRIEAWERAHGLTVGQSLLMAEDVIPAAASMEDWSTFARYVIDQKIGMIVFDTFARMAVGVDENSAKEVGAVVKRLGQISKYTKVGVMVVHHSSKGVMEARGSGALKGAMDSELVVTPVDKGAVTLPEGEGYTPIEVAISKQKNATAAVEPMQFLLSPFEDSVILTGPSGQIGDPMDQFVTVRKSAEPVIETATRIHQLAERFTQQGITRADAFTGVPMDDYHRTATNPERLWKLRIAEAVDLALKIGLLQTLSGTASGTRYIVTGMTRESARQKADGMAVADPSSATE
ncbi:DNA polymerase/primase [Rhodococcus phage ReqiPine5]|uniref:Gp46 n=1 Tax=Rhodococcus phage ReqiPine5 TaxID=691963 RepID=D4P821_9CAUD|nr:DNA polymerase/primase [Rhodococcus phage ReqiPine5]ADD81151.1 gp46 [Rhodococcus phage ReqiPine5]